MIKEKENWEIIRCIYDEMGMHYNEIENPEKFVEGEEISWCIVTVLDFHERKIARIELEGTKENLEIALR